MAYSSAGGGVSLPDFRNFGVLIRVLVLAELMNGLALLAHARSLPEAWAQVGEWAPLFEVVLLVVLGVLAAVAPVLGRLPYRRGAAVVLVAAATVSLLVPRAVAAWLGAPVPGNGLRVVILAVAVAAALLAYFDWRHRVLSPALGEARLAALEARIRPHFLFNSLNTVVALVRDDPALAERVLLDLSDLFRALLGEERGLVPLEKELALAQAYGEIEAVRLGARLRLHWQCNAPADAQVPLLILQPLLENALRHGVEPEPEGGEVWVEVAQRGRSLWIEVRNSLGAHAGGTGGHGMALKNIDERLQLHFDAEARMRTEARDGQFVASLELPLRRGAGQ